MEYRHADGSHCTHPNLNPDGNLPEPCPGRVWKIRRPGWRQQQQALDDAIRQATEKFEKLNQQLRDTYASEYARGGLVCKPERDYVPLFMYPGERLFSAQQLREWEQERDNAIWQLAVLIRIQGT